MAMLSLHAFRLPLLLALTIFSFLEFLLAVIVVPYQLRTYGGYNASAAELAFTGGLAFLLVPIVAFINRARPEGVLATVTAELAWTGTLWLFYIGGTGALMTETFHLLSCQNLFICRGFSGMLAFAWLSWLVLTALFATTLILAGRRWAGREEGVWSGEADLLWEEGWWGGVNQELKAGVGGGVGSGEMREAWRERESRVGFENV